jgi:hypothetical protein
MERPRAVGIRDKELALEVGLVQDLREGKCPCRGVFRNGGSTILLKRNMP